VSDRGAPPGAVATGADVARAIGRIAHEIVERNHDASRLVVAGLQRGGVWVAQELGRRLAAIDPSLPIVVGSLDVSLHRDDIDRRPVGALNATSLPADVDGATVVLVDDVLYTGRTVRAALEALMSLGRPRAVQLAVLVDRGHRELPIRPDFVGKNLPTNPSDDVEATADGIVVRRGGAT
jgi:pyrimidine operon attenuation protein/uracil phosphoribosyltransferase